MTTPTATLSLKVPDLAAPMAIDRAALASLLERLPAAITAAARRPLAADDGAELPDGCERVEPERRGATAVLPIAGPILYGCDPWLAAVLGCCTMEEIQEAAEALRRDDSVAAVVLKIDSPGGSVAGSADTLRALRDLAASKPVYAIAADSACSMAYMFAATARQIAATPTATVGSIGVISAAVDASKAYEQEGLERVVYSSGTLKAHGVEGAPITTPQRLMMQRLVDGVAEFLIGGVAAGRGIDAPTVSSYEGAVFSAKDATARKLVDVIDTSESYIRTIAERHATPAPAGSSLAAQSRGRGDEVTAMADKIQLPSTPDELKAVAPELYQSMLAHASQQLGLVEPEKPATAAQLRDAFADDPAFAINAAADGLTLSAAKAKYAGVLSGKLSSAAAKIQELEAKAAQPVKIPGADPVAGTVTAAGATSGPADIMAAARAIQAAEGCNFREAMSRAHKRHPELSHKARTQGIN